MSSRIKSSVLFAAILMALASFWPIVHIAASELTPASGLDKRISAAMEDWGIPGLGIVVVKEGKTVLMKGYGSRTTDASQPITAETWLQIASNSKTFTAYVFGMLVDDGLVRWDDPVKKHIPELKLPDRYVEQHVAIDDLLTHRSGLTPVPLGGFQNADYTIEDLLDSLAETPLAARFRAENVYSQAGMALLGEIVHRKTGMAWEEFVRTRIFKPLGMTASYANTTDFRENIGDPGGVSNIMQPAVKKDGMVQRGSWKNIGTEHLYAPAGGIITTMVDISKWIQFRLNDGINNGKALISPQAVKEIRKPRMPFGLPLTSHPCASLVSTGFGQYSFEHRGYKTITHSGGWMSSVIEVMPEADIGVGIFSNAWFDEPLTWTSLIFVHGLALEILDHYLGYEETPWTDMMAEIVSARAAGRHWDDSWCTQPLKPGEKRMADIPDNLKLTESEVREAIEAELKAWREGDTDRVAELQISAGIPSFGFRQYEPRLGDFSDSEFKQILKEWYNQLEYFDIWIEDIHVRVFGNVGVALITHVEDFKMKGREPERITVRSSIALQRRAPGEIVGVLAHRDIQEFDENGVYIPRGE